MPITNQFFGGKRRVYVSGIAESQASGWGQTAQTLAMVFNPVDGSPMLGPPRQEILDNANTATGQGAHADRLYLGPTMLGGGYRFWLTPEVLGRFGASAMGDCATTTIDISGRQHAITLGDDQEPASMTVEEHWDGKADTDNAWKFTGVFCNSFTVTVPQGNQYATLDVDLIGSKFTTAADQSALDVIANWPGAGLIPGTPPTKIGLYIEPTTGGDHNTTYDGTISTPSAAGTPFEDMATPTNYGEYSNNFSFTFSNNVSRDDLLRAGKSSGSGHYPGKPYAPTPTCTLSATLDLTTQSDEFVHYLRDITNASSKSFTVQITGVLDTLAGAGTLYYGFSIVVPAMKLVSVQESSDLGPVTVNIELMGMQDKDGNELLYLWTWDKITYDYDAEA